MQRCASGRPGGLAVQCRSLRLNHNPCRPAAFCPQNTDGSYGQVPYAAYFPQEVAAIVDELDDWITGEHALQSEQLAFNPQG